MDEGCDVLEPGFFEDAREVERVGGNDDSLHSRGDVSEFMVLVERFMPR